jgi:HSP20 family molecular chaperone IbpA
MSGNDVTDRRGATATATAEGSREAGRPALRKVAPAVDIYEQNDLLYLVADMPGVSGDAVRLDVDKDVLTISARFSGEGSFPGSATYAELSPVEYYRAFALGEDLDAARISASLKNGVLELAIPKAERAKTRKIPIQGG